MDGFIVFLIVTACAIWLVMYVVTIWRLTHPSRLTYAAALAHNLPTSPEEIGLEFTEHTFRLSDGTSTPGWIMKGRNPEGPCLIMTHGWGDGRYGMLPMADALSDFVSTIVVYDLRGQGESKTPSSRLGTTEVADLVSIIEEATRPGDRVVLIGFSMGAGISIAAAAAMKDDRVKAVIGEGGYRWGMEPIEGYYKINRFPRWPVLWLVKLHLSILFSSDAKFDRARHAAMLRCPLRMLHGTKDPISPFESARQIAAAAKQGRFVPFEGGEHLGLVEVDQRKYFEEVVGALREGSG